jgi:hypothetical protein
MGPVAARFRFFFSRFFSVFFGTFVSLFIQKETGKPPLFPRDL